MKFYSIVLCTIVLFSSCSQKINKITVESIDMQKFREFQFTYQVKLNKSDQNVEVWIPIPRSILEVQTITNEKFDSGVLSCEKLLESIHQNHYYYCSSESLIDDTILSYTCDVSRNESSPTRYKDVNPDNYDQGTNNITVPEGKIFSDIISDNGLSSNNMKLVYRYVLEGMHYGKPKNIDSEYYNDPWLTEDGVYGIKKVNRDEVVDLYQDAKLTNGNYTFGNGNSQYACDIGVGNCTDYHSYFMSLSRTMDVPARFHMGFSIPTGDGGKIGGYHCWTDYYIKGVWYPVDISEADKNLAKADYFFGSLDYNRVEFTTGRDLDLYNYKKHVNFFIYPLVEGTTFTKSFNYKNI